MKQTMGVMLTGQKLRAIRALRGISQAELAHRAGISPVSVATFESGKSDMRASTIVKLCEALSVQVRYFVDDVEISGP
jgi:transcriptional regulator with XRE-family HTH domain